VPTRDQIGRFLAALYSDSSLKRRLLAGTFALLVVPTAVLVALGVPEKPAYVAMCALILPLQFALYLWGTTRLLPKMEIARDGTSAYPSSARRSSSGP
jgi:predicted MFS family arabinose efflux permease